MSEELIYLSGTNFCGPVGTDRQLAEAMSTLRPVLWVDPPVAIQRMWRKGGQQPELTSRKLRMVRTWGPPLITRAPMRSLADALYGHQSKVAVGRRRSGLTQILTNALHGFLPHPGRRVLFLTDDWIAGADLMGLQTQHIRQHLVRNIVRSDLVVGVTQHLIDRYLAEIGVQRPSLVIPNGCDPDIYSRPVARPPDLPSHPYAILIGQLNERLDLKILDALAGAGLPVVVAGSRRERSAEFARHLDALFANPSVHYVGQLDRNRLAGFVQHAAVGLVPYRLDQFNLASAPLKTWDYLAAGISAVSTDLPASRAIDSPFVHCALDPTDFLRHVDDSLRRDGRSMREERQALARAHSWRKAAVLLNDAAIQLSQ